MAAAAPLSAPSLSLIPKLKTLHFINAQNSFTPSFHTPLLAFPSLHSPKEKSHNLNSLPNVTSSKPTKTGKIFAGSGNYLLSDSGPADNSQEIVSTGDDGVSNVISALLFVAFVGLFILTIGVVYIAVTDFLQKREGEKFKKEEAAKKKSGKRGKVRVGARDAPRGFGQKIEADDDFDELD